MKRQSFHAVGVSWLLLLTLSAQVLLPALQPTALAGGPRAGESLPSEALAPSADIDLPVRAEMRTVDDFVDEASPQAQTTLSDLPRDVPRYVPYPRFRAQSSEPIAPEIQALAQKLGNSPQRIFNYLQNEFEYEPYYRGLVKGPVETLYQQAGNDYDLADLLVALLRSGGTPARYAKRRIVVSADTAKRWIGVSDAKTAGNILETSGQNPQAVGEYKSYIFDHVWVEAFVQSGSKRRWVALDPSYKMHRLYAGRNVLKEAGLTGRQFMDSLRAAADARENTGELSSIDLERVNEILQERREKLIAYLERKAPNLTLNQVIGGKTIIRQNVGRLPARPPYPGNGATRRFNEIPQGDQQVIRFQVQGLDVTRPIAKIAHQKVTLTFAPATPADQRAIDGAGGLFNVQPRSVNLKPQLRLNDVVVAEGTGSPIGDFLPFTLDFLQRGASRIRSEHSVSVGGIYAVALDTQTVPVEKLHRSGDRLAAALQSHPSALSSEFAGEMLHALGLSYFWFNDLVIEYLAGTQNAVVFQKVSEALVKQDLLPDRSGSHPRMKLGPWKIDVKQNTFGLFDRSGSGQFREFPLLYTIGATSSSLEHLLFRFLMGWPAISTMQFMVDAADNEVPIYDVGPENIASVLTELKVPEPIKDGIRRAKAGGHRVVIPQKALKLVAWSGIGNIEYEPRKGDAVFGISGGLNGAHVIIAVTIRFDPEDIPRLPEKVAQSIVSFLQDPRGFIEKGGSRGGQNNLLPTSRIDSTRYPSEGQSDTLLLALRKGGNFATGLLEVGNIRDVVADRRQGAQASDQSATDLTLVLLSTIPAFPEALKACKLAPYVTEVVLQSASDPSVLAKAFQSIARTDAPDLVTQLFKSSDRGIEDVADASFSLGKSRFEALRAIVKQGGLNVAVFVIGDGGRFAGALGLNRENFDSSRAAEVVLRHYALVGSGLQEFGDFSRKQANQEGLDLAARDPVTGRFQLFHAEGSHFEGNFPLLRLPEDNSGNRPLSSGGLLRRVNESHRLGFLNVAQRDELKRAISAGNYDPVLFVVKPNYGGGTISKKLGEDPILGANARNPIKPVIVYLGPID